MNALALAAQVLQHVAEQPYAADVAAVDFERDRAFGPVVRVLFCKPGPRIGAVYAYYVVHLAEVACAHVHCGWQDGLTVAHATWLRELQPPLKDDPQQLCANARAMLPRRSNNG